MRDSEADRFSRREDCDGDLDRWLRGVARGELASEVDELKDTARLCKLNDLDSLAFRSDNLVTCNQKPCKLNLANIFAKFSD